MCAASARAEFAVCGSGGMEARLHVGLMLAGSATGVRRGFTGKLAHSGPGGPGTSARWVNADRAGQSLLFR